MKVFLVVGTLFPFDRLVKEIDEWVANKPEIQVTGQIGSGKYQPTHIEWLLTFAGIAMFCFLFYLFSKFIPILPVVHVKEGRNYADLRRMVENKILKRKIKELKMKDK